VCRRRPFIESCLLIFCAALHALASGQTPSGPTPVSVESLLRDLRPQGIDVIFSSDLVPPELLAPATLAGNTPLEQAVEALAAHGLVLRPLARNRYVVVRAQTSQVSQADAAPMEEISVYASRYSIEGRVVAEPRVLSASDIEVVPGSHDDSLRSLKSLPGLASNASGRPYIRGSLADDILVRYDGITLLDPFHFKNFQSLISAIDPAAVERIDVFSGGFPVRYGTRSGGVIDVAAPIRGVGYENRVSLSLISGGISTVGKADELPLEWLFALRRSTVDLFEPVEEEFGQPQFSDTLGRLRWNTRQGAWTLGWLLLDDQLELGASDDAEDASANYRDEYLWLARDHEFSPELRTRATAILTSSNRHRVGLLDEPGVAVGSVDTATEYDRVELNNFWTWQQQANASYTFGGEFAASRAEYSYSRAASYDPVIAAAFERPTSNDLEYLVDPRVFTYALYAAGRRRWESFEGEFGLRLDGQHYNLGGDHTQISPRLNLRYDRSDHLRFYASVGRFTQAQHVEEWRVEEAQFTSDPAQISIHTILGLDYEPTDSTHWGFELYTKRWTTAAPYFDNRLDPLVLSPDLAPDRIRIDPGRSEASGFELNLRHDFSDRLSASGTLSWSRVADDMEGGDVLRSWDQPLALTAGLTWRGSRLSLSALGGWHRGWPRNPFELVPPAGSTPGEVLLGERNSDRWGDFYTLDLRGSFTWPLSSGDFTAVLEVTNATDHENQCCASLRASDDGMFFESETGHWLPVIINLGFTYRWRSRD
jgi:outer membrane receptor protein involved in Fe transport